MSAGNTVWPLVRDLAAALDGSRESSERTLDQLEGELRSLPRQGREEIRQQMIQIVAALSRLEIRTIAADGPLKSSV